LAIGRTLNDAALDGNYAATLKSRADHTDRVLASQDCVITAYAVDFVVIISVKKHRLWSNHRTAAAGIMAMLVAALGAAWLGCRQAFRVTVSKVLRFTPGDTRFGRHGPRREAISGHDPKVSLRLLRRMH
jgi:hypothetical protein